MARDPRNYGFGDSPKVKGAPRIVEASGRPCPHCGCAQTYAIEVDVENPPPHLRRPAEAHRVVGLYVGCAACPWASPMMTTCVLIPN